MPIFYIHHPSVTSEVNNIFKYYLCSQSLTFCQKPDHKLVCKNISNVLSLKGFLCAYTKKKQKEKMIIFLVYFFNLNKH